MDIILKKPVRIAFVNVEKPKKTRNGERYSLAALIEPGSEVQKQLDETMLAVAEAKWPGDVTDKNGKKTGKTKGAAILAKLIEDGNVCFKHKPATNEDGEVYDGFDGMFTLNAGQASDKGAPLVVGRDLKPLVPGGKRPYSGSYAVLKVGIWAQDNEADKGGKRINADIKVVQFFKDGDAFSGSGTPTVEGMEPLAVEEDEAASMV